MKLLNFSFSPGYIELVSGGKDFDLHNEYEFISFHYNVQLRELIVNWQISNGEWVRKDQPKKLTIKFNEVAYLQIVKNEAKDFREDDKCLDIIGYANYDMRNDFESFLEKQMAQDNDIIMIFLNQQTIRVNAESVELILAEQ